MRILQFEVVLRRGRAADSEDIPRSFTRRGALPRLWSNITSGANVARRNCSPPVTTPVRRGASPQGAVGRNVKTRYEFFPKNFSSGLLFARSFSASSRVARVPTDLRRCVVKRDDYLQFRTGKRWTRFERS